MKAIFLFVIILITASALMVAWRSMDVHDKIDFEFFVKHHIKQVLGVVLMLVGVLLLVSNFSIKLF